MTSLPLRGEFEVQHPVPQDVFQLLTVQFECFHGLRGGEFARQLDVQRAQVHLVRGPESGCGCSAAP